MGLFGVFKRKQATRSTPDVSGSPNSELIKSTAKFDKHFTLSIASLKLYEQCVSHNNPINYQALGFKSASSVIALLADLTKRMSPALRDCYDQAVIREKTRVLSIAPDDMYNKYDVIAAPLFFLNVCAKDAMEFSSGLSAAGTIDRACQLYRSIAQPLDDMTSMNEYGSLSGYIETRSQGYAWVAGTVEQVNSGDAGQGLTFYDYMNRALNEVEQMMRKRGDLT